jgi:hypothetical protein
MAQAQSDAVIFGLTNRGARFRPSDWNERLAGLTSAFGQDHKLVYSPFVHPMDVGGVKALVVGGRLAEAEPAAVAVPRAVSPATNDLEVVRIDDALAQPHRIVAPVRWGAGGEPREPVLIAGARACANRKGAPGGTHLSCARYARRLRSALMACERRALVREASSCGRSSCRRCDRSPPAIPGASWRRRPCHRPRSTCAPS